VPAGGHPKNIEVDISHLVFGIEVRVKDLPHSEKLKFLTDETQMIAHITTVKEEVVAARMRCGCGSDSGRARSHQRRASRRPRVKARRGDAKVKAKPEKLKSEKKDKNSSSQEHVVRCWLFAVRMAMIANGEERRR